MWISCINLFLFSFGHLLAEVMNKAKLVSDPF